MTTIDTQFLLSILADATEIAIGLEGKDLDDLTNARKPEMAYLNRQLLCLADTCALAEAVVRNTYWEGRGQLSYDL